MKKSDYLKRERSQYQNCYNGAIRTANQLANSINTLNNLISTQSSCYKVDDVSGGSNYLNHLLDSENSIHDNIINNIIPDIKNKIYNLNNRIRDALQEEAMEGDN